MEDEISPVKLSRKERKRRYKEALALQNSTNNDPDHINKKIIREPYIPSHSLLATGDTLQQRICVISYDGTAFHGYQVQINHTAMRTVQGCIEDAIKRTTNENIRIYSASRTDKGVHAYGQIISFQSYCSVSNMEFLLALNSRLPNDIVCRHMEIYYGMTPNIFYPREKSKGKIYRYQLQMGGTRPLLSRHTIWYIPTLLNINKMTEAIPYFTSKPIDFTAFTPQKMAMKGTEETEIPNMICTIESISFQLSKAEMEEVSMKIFPTIEDKGEKELRTLSIYIKGDRFLYKMVRNIVGTFVDIGKEKLNPHDVQSILESKERKNAGQGAPAHGLTLMEVIF